MRHVSLVLAALLALSPLAAASTGPFAGAVAQGETDTHAYDNNPTGSPCVEIITPYTVTLAYAPATDTLTLSAGGKTATGQNGVASVTFLAGVCASFDVTVSGTSVASLAAYTVTVTQHVGGLGQAVEWG